MLRTSIPVPVHLGTLELSAKQVGSRDQAFKWDCDGFRYIQFIELMQQYGVLVEMIKGDRCRFCNDGTENIQHPFRVDFIIYISIQSNKVKPQTKVVRFQSHG